MSAREVEGGAASATAYVGPALTAELRRAVCFHEAGHAVMHALGGVFVYGVEVAPVGATDWRTKGRKGAELADLWGVCHVSDMPVRWPYLQWDEEQGCFVGDRRPFRQLLAQLDAHHKGSKAESLRQIRAWMVGALGGPVAEALHLGQEPDLMHHEFGEPCDLGMVEALSWFLPWRDLAHLEALTLRTLQRPDVWAYVEKVAAALHTRGVMGDEVTELLPPAVKGWPQSSRAKQALPFVLKGGAA
jgi:hypothetical protein